MRRHQCHWLEALLLLFCWQHSRKNNSLPVFFGSFVCQLFVHSNEHAQQETIHVCDLIFLTLPYSSCHLSNFAKCSLHHFCQNLSLKQTTNDSQRNHFKSSFVRYIALFFPCLGTGPAGSHIHGWSWNAFTRRTLFDIRDCESKSATFCYHMFANAGWVAQSPGCPESWNDSQVNQRHPGKFLALGCTKLTACCPLIHMVVKSTVGTLFAFDFGSFYSSPKPLRTFDVVFWIQCLYLFFLRGRKITIIEAIEVTIFFRSLTWARISFREGPRFFSSWIWSNLFVLV